MTAPAVAAASVMATARQTLTFFTASTNASFPSPVKLGDVHYLDGERLSCGTPLVRVVDGAECRFERDRGEARIYLDGDQWVPIGDGDRFTWARSR